MRNAAPPPSWKLQAQEMFMLQCRFTPDNWTSSPLQTRKERQGTNARGYLEEMRLSREPRHVPRARASNNDTENVAERSEIPQKKITPRRRSIMLCFSKLIHHHRWQSLGYNWRATVKMYTHTCLRFRRGPSFLLRFDTRRSNLRHGRRE